MARSKGKIITVTSTKGGVGKTILTLFMAGIYANQKKKVLIIDIDLYGGAIALNLNIKSEKTIYHYVDDISNNRYHDFYDYTTKYNEYIDVISCPKDPRQANKINPKYVEMLLDNAQYRYDVILLDTTHTLNRMNIMILDIASQIVYVMTNDPMDLKNTKSFMAILDDIEKENVTLVLNQARDPELNYFSNFDIRNITKHKIDYTVSKNAHIKNITKHILDGNIIPKDATKENMLLNHKDMEHLKKMTVALINEEK